MKNSRVVGNLEGIAWHRAIVQRIAPAEGRRVSGIGRFLRETGTLKLLVLLALTGWGSVACAQTPAPTATPTETPTPAPTPTGTLTPAPTPTGTLTPDPTATPSPVPTPVIIEFSPTSSGPNGTVIITGTGFTDATAVRFAGTDAAAFFIDSDTQITAIVPFDFGSGRITIITPGGTARSNTFFTVTFATATPLGDRTPPTVTITSPRPGSGYSNISKFPDIAGNVADQGGNTSGVARVDITIRRLSDGKYWNGSAWINAIPQALPTPAPTAVPFPTPTHTPRPTPTVAPTPDGTLEAAPMLEAQLIGTSGYALTTGLPAGADLIYDIYTVVVTAIDNSGNSSLASSETKVEPGGGVPTATPVPGGTPTAQTTPQETTQATPQTTPTVGVTPSPTPVATATAQPTATATTPPVPTATATLASVPPPGVVPTPVPTPANLIPVYQASSVYMVSIPYMDGQTPGATTTVNRAFSPDMVSGNLENFRLYDFDPLTQEYLQLGGDSTIQRGKGYFLAPLEPGVTLEAPGTGSTRQPLAGPTFTITLRCDPSTDFTQPNTGYNLIGFPFNPLIYRSINWEESTVTNDGVTKTMNEAAAAGWLERTVKATYQDSARYYSTTTLRPFRGYWARTFINGLQVKLVGSEEAPDDDPLTPQPTATPTTPSSTATPVETPGATVTPRPTATALLGSGVAWGDNRSGQLGDDTSANNKQAILVINSGVLSGKVITGIAAGALHSVARTENGAVYAWGENANGQLGNGRRTDSDVPVEVDMSGVLEGKLIIDVAAGAGHTLALAADGTIYAWGDNSSGQLGNGTAGDSSVPVAVSVGGALAGKVVTAIAAGKAHSMARTADGLVYSWGEGSNGELGTGNSIDSNVPIAVTVGGALAGKTVSAIAAGNNHSLALDSNGIVYVWGDNSLGQLGDGTTNDSNAPKVISRLAAKVITLISTGQSSHSLALASDGSLFAWGNNSNGQLGDGTVEGSSTVPVLVVRSGLLSGKTITKLAAGGTHSLALATDGEVYSWGSSLGAGLLADSAVPQLVTRSTTLLGKTYGGISAGTAHSLAFTSN